MATIKPNVPKWEKKPKPIANHLVNPKRPEIVATPKRANNYPQNPTANN